MQSSHLKHFQPVIESTDNKEIEEIERYVSKEISSDANLTLVLDIMSELDGDSLVEIRLKRDCFCRGCFQTFCSHVFGCGFGVVVVRGPSSFWLQLAGPVGRSFIQSAPKFCSAGLLYSADGNGK